jgi:arginine decarboxylase-like protein
LLGTDSRGAYFEDFLSQHNLFPNDWEIHIDVTPGGTIKTISEKHLTKVKTLPDYGKRTDNELNYKG